MVLDKWGIAQLDSVPCYFSIKKISSVKSFSEIRWRVLLGGSISKAYLILKMILSQEASQESAPWRVNKLIALCFDGLVTQWRLPCLYLLGSPEFKGLSPACLWFTSINAILPLSLCPCRSQHSLFVCDCCSHCVRDCVYCVCTHNLPVRRAEFGWSSAFSRNNTALTYNNTALAYPQYNKHLPSTFQCARPYALG